MPTYSYACTACEHHFDAVQKFTDPSLTGCPECSGRLRKLFSSVGIVFKGSGFYRNDSRSSNGAESGSKDKSEAGSKDSKEKSESGSNGKSKPGSESKPATDSPSKSGSASSSGSATTTAS